MRAQKETEHGLCSERICLGLPVRDQGTRALCESAAELSGGWGQGAACAHLAAHAQVARDDEARRERVGLHGDGVPEGR